jgi:hypothetical protein
MTEKVIPIGVLVGLSKESFNHQIGVFLGNFLYLPSYLYFHLFNFDTGDDNLVIVFEHGSDINSSLDEIEKIVKSDKDLKEFPITNQYVRSLDKLEKDSYKIVASKLNIFEFKENEKDFFDIMRHNFNEINKLEIGDVVFFDRGFYNHSGILANLNNFDLVHKNAKHKISELVASQLLGGGNVDKAGEIRVNYLLDAIKTSKIYKFNFYDEQYPPL